MPSTHRKRWICAAQIATRLVYIYQYISTGSKPALSIVVATWIKWILKNNTPFCNRQYGCEGRPQCQYLYVEGGSVILSGYYDNFDVFSILLSYELEIRQKILKRNILETRIKYFIIS